jgi:enamine deaminase RidA (YjgF/YER057c/UK114 family)
MGPPIGPICEARGVSDALPVSVRGLYPGAPYDYGAIAPHGALLFTAGACPLDADGHVVGLNDLRAQAAASVENLGLALAHFNARFQDLVKTTVFVVGGPDDLVTVWTVVADRLAPQRPPSTLLGVSALGYPGQLVEIEGIAAVPADGAH